MRRPAEYYWQRDSDTRCDNRYCICKSLSRFARITTHRAELLMLVLDYRTNAEIAAALGVAPATVKRTIEDLRSVTGCRSKRDLARWWAVHYAVWLRRVVPLQGL